MPPANGTTRPCEVCGKPFYSAKSQLRVKRCSRECYWRSRWGDRRMVKVACVICSTEFDSFQSNRRVVCSRACDNERKSRTQSGENSILWRGGFNFPYVGTWRRQRRLCLARDGSKCVLCGSTNRPQVHHITPARYGGTHDLDNLITLCRSCHSKEELKVNEHYRTTLLHGRPRRKGQDQAA